MCLLGLPTLLYPYGRDQAMFAYVGWVWQEGGLPYRDAWDVKLPGIYAVYALLRAIAGPAEWAPRLLDLVAFLASALALDRLWRRVVPGSASTGGTQPGILPAAVLTLFTLGAVDYWNLSQVETLIAPMLAWSVVMALERRYFWAGVLAGTAACFKTTAVLGVIPAGLLALFFAPRPRPGPSSGLPPLVRLGAGWLLPLALVVAYFGARGGLPYLAELLEVQREYAGGDPRTSGMPWWELAWRLELTGYLPVVLLSALVLSFFWAGRRKRPYSAEAESLRTLGAGVEERWAVAAWWLAAILQVVVQRRFYLYHWAVLTPAAAWLTAWLLHRWWSQAGMSRQPIRILAARLGLLLGTGVVVGYALAPRGWSMVGAASVLAGQQTVTSYQDRFVGVFQHEVRRSREAALQIRRGTDPGDRILVIPFQPEIYLYSGRRSSTRHASSAPIFTETSIQEARRRAWLSEMLADLRTMPPAYVVDCRDETPNWPSWAQPLRETLATTFQTETGHGLLRVHRKRTASP